MGDQILASVDVTENGGENGEFLEMERHSQKIVSIGLSVVGVGMVLFHIISVRYPLQPFGMFLVTHVGFALVLVFLSSLRKSAKLWFLTLTLLGASIAVSAYVEINFEDLALRGFDPTLTEVMIGSLLIFLLLEGVRRAMGSALTIVGLCLLFYLFFGHYIPAPFGSMEYIPSKTIANLSIAVPGIYGKFVKVSANYLFLLVIFAAILQKMGGNEFFTEFGKFIGRGLRMGTALTAIVGSSLVGMVTGIPGANVATTGSFTIPLMKNSGYSPEQAGAIEAAASNGGHIMPPVMGIAAFLMAELIGVPYVEIIKSAFIPAILYFATVTLYAHLQANKMKIAPMTEPVNYRVLAINAPLFVIPLAIIIVVLLSGFSVMTAAFWAVLSAIALCLLIKKEARSFKMWVEAFTEGAILGARLGITCTILGMLTSTVIKTGLGIKLPGLVEMISAGNFFVALLLVAIVSLILGLGMSTSAAYMLVAIIAAPVLLKMGLHIFQAHFFVFYFACFSVLTPPVGAAAITASIIAKANYFRTGLESIKAAFAGFILPFAFIYSPLVLLRPVDPPTELLNLIVIAISLVAAEVAIVNYWLTECNPRERTLSAACSIMLLMSVPMQSLTLGAAGGGLFLVLTITQLMRRSVLEVSRDGD